MGIMCFTAPTQCFQVFYMCMFQRCCARFRDVVHVPEMLCTFPSSCACFTEVAHVSQKLCTFHKPPNNVRVQLHWGDQRRSPDIYIYIYICAHIYICASLSLSFKHVCVYADHIMNAYVYIYMIFCMYTVCKCVY